MKMDDVVIREDEISALPKAQLRPQKSGFWIWLLPLAALGLAIWLMASAWQQQGLPITLSFEQGHGLQAGDELRYRGIAAGKVDRIQLSPDLGGITATVLLEASAADLAKTGSRFWIVRPQFSIGGARGLDTVIGANYLGVTPGQGELQREFVGLEKPPLLDLMEPGGLEILLSTQGLGSLREGAAVSYRQVVIGAVVAVDLAKDASAVEARAYIKPAYRNLIRDNIKFWRTSAARFSAGLQGLSVDVDSVHSLILGGVNLAIPAQPGALASAGAKFELHQRPQPEWLEWTPGLSLYDGANATSERPQMLLMRLHWTERNLVYWPVDQQRQAWALPVADGFIGPADVLIAPADAQAASVKLQLGQVVLNQQPSGQPYAPGLAQIALTHEHRPWPLARQRQASVVEDALAIADSSTPARFIAAERQTLSDSDWIIDPALPFSPLWHGAAVVAASDGVLLGILLVTDEQVRIARLAAAPEPTAKR